MEHTLDLQFFADAGTLVNATGNYVNASTGATTAFSGANTLSAEMKDFYDTELLENARVEQLYAQFAKRQPLPVNHKGTVEWRKWNTFAPATALTEGVIPTGQKFGVSAITGAISQYGTYTAITDRLELRAYDDVILGATEEMGASAAETQEKLIRDALLTNANVLYCDNVKDGAFVSTPTSCATMLDNATGRSVLTPAMVNKAVTILKKNRVPRINGRYYAVIHPSVAHDLRECEGWIEAHKYAAPDELFNGEIGELHGVRFIEDVFAPVLGGDTYKNAQNGVTYATYFFGKDSFGIIDPEGGALEMIIHGKGEIGGPLNQFSTIGYKFETNGAGLSGAGVYGNGACLYSFGTNYGSGSYLRCGSADDSYRDLGSWKFTVSHNANGDASFTVGLYGSVLAMYFSGTGYTYSQCFIGTVGAKASGTITIHENAASTIASAPSSLATRETYALTMKRLAAANYHIATFKHNDSTVLYTSGRFDTSLRFDVPRSWFAHYASDAALPVTVSVQTYNSSGMAIGSPATASLTVNADADMHPVISGGWVSLAPFNTGAAAGILGYVKGYSQAEAIFDETKVDMTNAVGASIASFSVTCQGETEGTSPYRTPVLASTSVPVVCTVTDTRGRTASETFTLSVMDYARPALTGIAIFRCDEQGEEAASGTRYSAKAVLTCSPLGGQNVPTFSSAVAASGGGYGAEEALAGGAAHISTAQLSADVTYTVRLTATDALGNTAVYYQVLPTRKWAMKFRPTGNGVAFGKAAEYDGTFEITEDWDFRVHGKEINTLVQEKIFSLVYPVGSIYMSVNSADPGTLFGGTWERLEDTFLLAAGANHTAGSTGGEETHALTVNEMPSHDGHVYNEVRGGNWAGFLSVSNATAYGSSGRGWNVTAGNELHPAGDTLGGNAAHNNMPPYLAVYMWKRTG